MSDQVEDVKARAAQGSRKDYSRLIDMVIQGVPGAREALEELAPTGDSGESAADPAAERDALWAEFVKIKESLNQDPTSFADLEELRRRARGFGPCEEVRAISLEAYRLRRLGHLRATGDLLAEARDLGASCRACQLDVGRRHAILLAALEEHAAALAEIDECLAGYRQLGPGHDSNGDGVASCLSVRGKIRYFLGDPRGASADLAANLERLRPGTSVFLRAQIDLGKALFGCGAAGREEAYQLLRKPRLIFRSLPPCPDRAVFDWLDGQLEFTRPDNKNRHRGRQKIRNAVDEFGARRMPDDFLGAAADFIKTIRRNREAILSFLQEIYPIAKELITEPEHLRRLQAIVNECTGPPSPQTWCRLAGAIDDLRAGLANPLLPCLVS